MTTELATVLIVGYFLICILVVNRKAKKEGVSFMQAYSMLLSDKFSDKDQKAKKDKKDSRMTPQQDAMSDYPWKRDPWRPWRQAEKQKEKQKAQSGRKDSRSISGIEKIFYILVLLGCAWYGLSVYGGSGSYTNGTNNGSSNTRYANGVTVNNVKEYFGYGSETVVVDCSECRSSKEINEKMKETLKSFPERIIVWGVAFWGHPNDYPFMPESFWVLGFNSNNYEVDGTYVTVMEPFYTVTDPDEIARMQREIDAAAQEIIAKCPGELDQFGSCKVIHDELIKRNTYDHSLQLPHIYDLYGALVTGDAVCQGYAFAFAYLTNLMGYESEVVVSSTHAWNRMITPIDCNDYFIDVTWDDKDYQDDNGNDVIVYDYFGLTREEVEAIDSHAIAGINGTEEVIDDYTFYSYHKRFGYVCSSDTYSYDEVVRLLSMQDVRNGNSATIKFLDEESWNAAKSELLSGDPKLLTYALRDAKGGRFRYHYRCNDKVRVLDVMFDYWKE